MTACEMHYRRWIRTLKVCSEVYTALKYRLTVQTTIKLLDFIQRSVNQLRVTSQAYTVSARNNDNVIRHCGQSMHDT